MAILFQARFILLSIRSPILFECIFSLLFFQWKTLKNVTLTACYKATSWHCSHFWINIYCASNAWFLLCDVFGRVSSSCWILNINLKIVALHWANGNYWRLKKTKKFSKITSCCRGLIRQKRVIILITKSIKINTYANANNILIIVNFAEENQ